MKKTHKQIIEDAFKECGLPIKIAEWVENKDLSEDYQILNGSAYISFSKETGDITYYNGGFGYE